MRIQNVSLSTKLEKDRIRQKATLYLRWSWRLCLHGARLHNRADPSALGSS